MSVDVVLAGVGGYGASYLELMRPAIAQGAMRLAGAVEPAPGRTADMDDLRARGVPVWKDLGDFLAADVPAALIVLATPIQHHAAQTCAALERGLAVLCEKPAAASLDEVRRMAAARERAGRLVAIGYQWSFSTAMRRLRRDIAECRFGRARRLRAWVAWPRDAAYYGRNGWAGRIRDAAGRLVNDSPVNNATAHYLHNMFFVLGLDGLGPAARPFTMEAEIYRANAIENFDTACLRLVTDDNTEILFFASHAVDQTSRPTFIYEFERGTVAFGAQPGGVRATLPDGTSVDYGNPDGDAMNRKLLDTLAAVREGSRETPGSLEAAAMQTRVIDALQQMTTRALPAACCRTMPGAKGSSVLTYVPGLFDAMRQGFEQGRLFSEMNLPWAVPAQTVVSRSEA
jgi:predicted dehydrogenase